MNISSVEREESGPEGDVEGRTGAKCYAEKGVDLMGKVHTISVHELAPDGNWQVAKRKRIVSTSHAWAGLEKGH
ncbi:hypothetical protein CesoFtcFv8_015355 [Champsocephalus esox]|uniref:Uncharacterized protein n=2 Tax=Champsocephalus TaxID=52236 RepID=A0AAN8HL41_CHAGU|nr:hypothetical protein CesoFtcFv8_015355 [Champsocephalus esox]KAK5919836.1 hypothetical protein CgunFtcFv8_023699 [Champsocephalus gunnari]